MTMTMMNKFKSKCLPSNSKSSSLKSKHSEDQELKNKNEMGHSGQSAQQSDHNVQRSDSDNDENSEPYNTGGDNDNIRDNDDGSYVDGMNTDAGTDGSWGCKFDDLPKAPSCFTKPLPVLRQGPDHEVFFVTTAKLKKAKEPPRPLGGKYKDDWNDTNFVKMPSSKHSTIPDDKKKDSLPCQHDQISVTISYSKHSSIPDDKKKDGQTFRRWLKDCPLLKTRPKLRWKVIECALKKLKSRKTRNFSLLQNAILECTKHYQGSWDFVGLRDYFKDCSDEEMSMFFGTTLPKMITLALSLPRLFKQAIPFLQQGRNMKLTFSQQQVACLLANAFFCTFPHRNKKVKGERYPNINFSSLFVGRADEQKRAKIKCLLHYFERVTTSMPTGVITYERRVLQTNVDWANDRTKLTKLHMSARGTIEDEGRDMLQVDFANKYVGGGVLGHGCVQEEIRFLICPEMIISRLFTEVLQDNEVLVMTGCERFSSYTGYANTFRWKEDFVDTVERDDWGRRYTEVVAMDALIIKRPVNQFSEYRVLRELEKAYCAFQNVDGDQPAAVCTGNWGCGAFGGDKELKAVIQIMAASKAKRDVCFLTMGDKKLCQDLSKTHEFCETNELTVGDLFKTIKEHDDPRTSLLTSFMKEMGM